MSNIANTRLKTSLKKREFCLGTWITLGHPSIAEIMAQAGYQWAVIDNEHSMIPLDDIQVLIGTLQGNGTSALVRLSHNDASEIRKVMDAGADGVICPMINTPEDAKCLVDAVKYPPLGQRTYGLSRAQRYGAHSTEYFNSSNDHSIVIAQIEHITAVRNFEKILDVPGIDGFLTGPYDLSGSLHIPGQLTHPEVIQAEKQVLELCSKRGIACGAHLVHPNSETIQAKLDLGYSFLALGTDFIFLSEGARAARLETEKRTQS